MTDTQPTHMVGCYGSPAVGTPNLDRLASEGIRFDRAYCASPLCTPARSALFSGQHPQVNGAWANSMAPGTQVPLMGSIFSSLGYRTAYSGKWHLDGSGYFGDGEPGGGFEGDWWYDGKRYAEDLGKDRFTAYRTAKTADDLRKAGLLDGWMWGQRVADRAIDFLTQVGESPFLLVTSFDEPHGPYVAPPEIWESFDESVIPRPLNFGAQLDGKPRQQSLHRSEVRTRTWEEQRSAMRKMYACNQFVDRQIGRVVDAVKSLHGDDTLILYTTDHGDMQGSHGLQQKGPLMYEEVLRVPLIARLPGGSITGSCQELVSHVDMIPTLLDMVGSPVPTILNGHSFAAQLRHPGEPGRDHLMAGFHRFALNHDGWGGFYPIRCLVTRRHKLAINLFDSDELYDRDVDPMEVRNCIEEPAYADVRAELHHLLLEEMDSIRDPFRGFEWRDRSWREPGVRRYYAGTRRGRPSVFSFQTTAIEADGYESGPVCG